jgi:zinc protease
MMNKLKIFQSFHPAEGRGPARPSGRLVSHMTRRRAGQTPPFGGVVKYFAFILLIIIAFAHSALADSSKVLDVQKLKTPAGIEVWLVQDKTIPVISLSYSFDGGLAYDPDDKPGVGRLVSILLDEGAGDIMSQEFRSSLADNSIDMEFTAGRDAFHGHLKTLKANKDSAFHLLALALNKPRFDSDAVERLRAANIAAIKEDMTDPDWLVDHSFNGMVFEGHPYGAPALGTLDSMTRITRQDLLDYVHAQFGRDVLKVTIAGDISREEATKAVDDIFATLPAQAEKLDEKVPEFKSAGKTIMLPIDAPQTYISAGEAGVKRSDKDWAAATIMNFILGGNSTDARLTRELHKKRGLTSGITSTLTSMKYAGVIQVNFSADNDKVAESLQALQQEWTRLATEGATDEEVQAAKAYLTGSLPLELTSTTSITDRLNELQREGLDSDYINQRNSSVNAVTAADVKRVAARLLKADNLTTIIVGQPQGFSADIMLDHPPGMAVPQQKQ